MALETIIAKESPSVDQADKGGWCIWERSRRSQRMGATVSGMGVN
jgi:hypothetical protein